MDAGCVKSSTVRMRDRSEGALQPFFDGFEGLFQITRALTAVFGGSSFACPSPRRLERARNLIDGLCSFSTAPGRTTRKSTRSKPRESGRDVGADITGLKFIVIVKHRASFESLSILSWTATSAGCRTRRGGWWRSRRSSNGRSPTERRCSLRRFSLSTAFCAV